MRTLSASLIVICIFILCACPWNRMEAEIKKIDMKVEIQRFDRELFEMNPDTIPQAISHLYRKYQDFLEIFSYHIVSIGLPSERTYPGYLDLFVTDLLNREVYMETQRIFPDLKQEEDILAKAFKRYIYYFRENNIPEVVAFISRFNHSCFTVGHYVGIGLDMYLGTSSGYYKKLDIPQYMKTQMHREKMPSDIIHTWAYEIFPYHDSVNNALTQMIHQGKLMYFVQSLLPDQPEDLVMGYTKDQLKWVRRNEEMMWISLIEKKLLFSDNQMDIRKLIGPSPFTYFFTNESPGRAGVWIGWQIVKKFAERNPSLNLKQIMDETDYQKILQVSGYNPR